jgi:hypothetical protein
MKINPTKLTLLLFVASAVGLTGCKCISVPAQDSTPPKAAINIIFRDSSAGAPERTVTITSQDPGDPQDVLIQEGRDFQILYSGNDDGGIRSLTAEYENLGPTSVVNPDGSISQALVALPSIPDGDFSSCAMTTRILNFDWTMNRHASIKVKAIDFHGNVASTRTVHIRPL